MTERNVTHATFSLERTYEVPPARVFAAFSTEEGKQAWFSGANDAWELVEREFDFREGGREKLVGRWNTGKVSAFDCQYLEIVPDTRIIYAYQMHIDGVRISVSLATIELKPHGGGTRLIVTEQGAFLDGYDDAGSREHGTNWLIDKMGASLRQPVNA